MVLKYQNLIAEGHAERCPWRKSGCDGITPRHEHIFYQGLTNIFIDSIHRLPLTNAETTLRNLQIRYKNLVSAGIRLPPINVLIFPEKFNLESTLAYLPPGILDSRAEISEPANTVPSSDTEGSTEKTLPALNKAAFALAFFGWDIAGEANAGLAGCKACFRRLGLWMYTPREDGSDPLYSELNVVGEHLDYCPWINPGSQSGNKSGQCGWEALSRVVESEHRRHMWSKNKPVQAEQTSSSQTENIPELLDEETRKTKDREWWAKLLRVRQVLQPKGTKKTKPR